MGEDFSHDAIHDIWDAEDDEEDKLEGDDCASEDEAAVAADSDDASNEEADDEGAGCDGDDEPAVAADGLATDETSEAIVPLSGAQAEAVEQSQVQIASLQAAAEAIKPTGQMRTVVHLEREIATLKRRQREISKDSPAVADAFKRQRTAEEAELRERKRIVEQTKALKHSAQAALEEQLK